MLEPASLDATAKALTEAGQHYRQNLAAFELAVERARYDADRARRQYDAVEPENRLVARTLEHGWEDKLAAVRQAEHDLSAQQARRPGALTSRRTGLDHLGRRRRQARSSTHRRPLTPSASSCSAP